MIELFDNAGENQYILAGPLFFPFLFVLELVFFLVSFVPNRLLDCWGFGAENKATHLFFCDSSIQKLLF